MPDVDNLDPVGDNQDPEGAVVAADWRSGLESGVKDHPSIANFKTVGDLAKSYVNVQHLVGKEKIPVPGEKATKEDWDLVFDRLGRPKDPTGYKLPEIKVPDGHPGVNKEIVAEFTKKAHELGLLPNQVSSIFDWYMQSNIGEFTKFVEGQEQAKITGETALRKTWGKAFNQNLVIADKVVNTYASEAAINKLKSAGLHNDPDIIQFLYEVGKNFGEDGVVGKPKAGIFSPEEALAKIKEIEGAAAMDPKHPYFNKMHPEHEIFKKKMQDLYAMAYPENAK